MYSCGQCICSFAGATLGHHLSGKTYLDDIRIIISSSIGIPYTSDACSVQWRISGIEVKGGRFIECEDRCSDAVAETIVDLPRGVVVFGYRGSKFGIIIQPPTRQ